ncbi:serine protease inhibitor Kazal-type 1-like [Stigmatopora argus]
MTGRILLLGFLLVCVVAGIKASEGVLACSPEESDSNCPKIFEPVCGSDRITYPNRCVLCSKIPPVQIAYDGPCIE